MLLKYLGLITRDEDNGGDAGCVKALNQPLHNGSGAELEQGLKLPHSG